MRYLIPLAGGNGLFPPAEFHFPKPLIEIDGKPMVARVIDSLREADPDAHFIFIVRRQDCAEFSLHRTLTITTDGRCDILQIDRQTAGAACSALLAANLIDDDQPVVICNGDQVLETDIGQVLIHFTRGDFDAGVITFDAVHPRWSYVSTDAQGLVTQAAEKRVISRQAIAGFYYFRRGSDFIQAAQASILNERHSGGVYFIAPTLNELVLRSLRIGTYTIASSQYHSLFSPQRVEQYERYLQNRDILFGSLARNAPRVTVVIPMAGLGSRFANVGYTKPKPFIDMAGRPMIERVIENLAIPGARYVLIARAEHLEQDAATAQSLRDRGDVEFVSIDKVTEGATCTVLHARRYLTPDTPLLIANCDQLVDFDCAAYIDDCQKRQLDGSILVFNDKELNPKWSFARIDSQGHVREVQEKKPISSLATVGLYYFSRAESFINAALDMIVRNERVNNEFYVAPVYNHAISNGGKFGVYVIAAEAMHGIGTPDDFQAFMALRYPA